MRTTTASNQLRKDVWQKSSDSNCKMYRLYKHKTTRIFIPKVSLFLLISLSVLYIIIVFSKSSYFVKMV